MARNEQSRPVRVARLKNSVRVECKDLSDPALKSRFNVSFLVKDILLQLMEVQVSSIFCLQDFSNSGFMDVSFVDMATCIAVVEAWDRKKDFPPLKGLALRPLYVWEDVSLTLHMYNPFVEEADVRLFLARYCSKVEGGQKILNKFGIWTGKRLFTVRFQPDPASPGGVKQPPGSFAIGPHRGFLHYPGQPAYCRRCGAIGHTKATCKGDRCRLCGAEGHLSGACPVPKVCSVCGSSAHLFKSCPSRRRTFADLFSDPSDPPGEEGEEQGPMAGADGGAAPPSTEEVNDAAGGSLVAEPPAADDPAPSLGGGERAPLEARREGGGVAEEKEPEMAEIMFVDVIGSSSPPWGPGAEPPTPSGGGIDGGVKEAEAPPPLEPGALVEPVEWADSEYREEAETAEWTTTPMKRPLQGGGEEEAEPARRLKTDTDLLTSNQFFSLVEEVDLFTVSSSPSSSASSMLGWDVEGYREATGMAGRGERRRSTAEDA